LPVTDPLAPRSKLVPLRTWQFLLQAVREKDYEVFIVPGSVSDVSGMAYCSRDGRRHIMLLCEPATAFACRVLLHEMAHHELGHAAVWTSTPEWREEYEAEMYALCGLEALLDPQTHFDLVQQARERLRPILQDWLNDRITQHGETEAGVWAGCDIEWSLVEDTL